jgi:hypothetical protein
MVGEIFFKSSKTKGNGIRVVESAKADEISIRAGVGLINDGSSPQP